MRAQELSSLESSSSEELNLTFIGGSDSEITSPVSPSNRQSLLEDELEVFEIDLPISPFKTVAEARQPLTPQPVNFDHGATPEYVSKPLPKPKKQPVQENNHRHAWKDQKKQQPVQENKASNTPMRVKFEKAINSPRTKDELTTILKTGQETNRQNNVVLTPISNLIHKKYYLSKPLEAELQASEELNKQSESRGSRGSFRNILKKSSYIKLEDEAAAQPDSSEKRNSVFSRIKRSFSGQKVPN